MQALGLPLFGQNSFWSFHLHECRLEGRDREHFKCMNSEIVLCKVLCRPASHKLSAAPKNCGLPSYCNFWVNFKEEFPESSKARINAVSLSLLNTRMRCSNNTNLTEITIFLDKIVLRRPSKDWAPMVGDVNYHIPLQIRGDWFLIWVFLMVSVEDNVNWWISTLNGCYP